MTAPHDTPRSSATLLPAPAPVILRDGTTAWLRPALPNDLERVSDLFGRASRESLWLRFFTPIARVDKRLLENMVQIDGLERMTYLIVRGEGADETVLAIGSYARLPRWDTAEIAFFVDDAYQGRGLGTLLLERLAEHARRFGVVTLVAEVMTDNHRMLDVFRQSGFSPTLHPETGVIHVQLSVTPDELATARAEARDRVATAASLAPFFRPRAVAVIGASRTRGAIGNTVMQRLIQTGFEGPVYPVNPSARSVASVRAYPSVLDVPDEVDLAIIAVPAAHVLDVVDECARKRVRALVVLSAGFAETGPEGRERQNELVRKVRANGMRMIGPNCMGILNTAPDVSLNATFSPVLPRRGKVAMSSQSGALGLAILDYAGRLNLGISMFVSVGNKADVSGNDLIQYWEEDPETNLIILYLESFGNPRKFARLARRIARSKPILAVKSGRTAAGSRAASSHTAALAGSDTAVDALFRQAGVIRADTLDELFDVAALLTNQPLPEGNRVAIVTNAGGPGILAADACEANGLVLPALSEETLAALRGFLPAAAGLGNPVDMIASASVEHYESTVRRVLADAGVDALIVIYIPVGIVSTEDVARAVQRAVTAARTDCGKEKPVLACVMSAAWSAGALAEGGPEGARPIPAFRFPEAAARALVAATGYAAWKRRPAGHEPDLERTDARAVRTVIERALTEHGAGWLRPDAAAALLAAAGIATVAQTITRTPAEAAAAAEAIGFPVAVKLVSDTLTHKTEVGGVALDLHTAEAVRGACADMLERLGAAVEGFLVQKMVAGGTEVLVGVTEDKTFGPLVGFGLGGTAVEVLRDVAFRITPLTDTDAHDMVRAIRGLPLLEGYRGRPPADIAAIEDLLLRVSWLVEQAPQVTEMDLNPVKVFAPGEGYAIVDQRIRLQPA